MISFDALAGNNALKNSLKHALNERFPQTVLLSGDDPAALKTLATVLAAGILCEGTGSHPCGNCLPCRKVEQGMHPDLMIVDEGEAELKVDLARQLKAENAIIPNDGERRVTVIHHAQNLNPMAQNALLKELEEPPAYAVILLLTTNAESFLPTILSRCVTLNLKAVPDEKIKKFLMAHYQIPDYQADVCVAFAQGNVGKAIQLAASDDFNELKASALQLIKRLHDIDLYEMTEAVKQISEYKLQINDYFDLMMIWYRDVLYYKATKDVNGLIFKDEVYDIKRQAEQSSYNGIEEILQALSKAQVRLNANVNFDLVIELLLLTIKEN